MTVSIDLLERAAFACFSAKLEDSYKRLLFVKIASVLKQHPNISANRCYAQVSRNFQVDRAVFDSAVCALETPFKFIRVDSYTRKAVNGSQNPRQVSHLTVIDGQPWKGWLAHVTVNYPELLVWLSE